MVNKKGYTPQHCQHRRSGRGYVCLDGKQIPTGVWGSAEAEQKANELIAQWLANGRKLPEAMCPKVYRIEDLVADFWVHAEKVYSKHGRPTREINNVRDAVRPLLARYASHPVNSFTSADLVLLRDQVQADRSWARTTLNARIGVIKRIFYWGVQRGLVQPSTAHAIASVKGLRSGQSQAKDSKKVAGITEEQMRAVLPFLPRQVAAMIELQWHTAMRPGEVVQMRWADIDRSDQEWIYTPRSHKLEHMGIPRRIWIGPAAQSILRQWLKVDSESPIFSPREAEHERLAALRAARKSPMTPSQQARENRARRNPRSPIRDHYSTNTYAQAIARACVTAGIAVWGPNRLRHAAASRFRREAGLDVAQAVLGHTNASTTELYAPVDDHKVQSSVRTLG